MSFRITLKPLKRCIWYFHSFVFLHDKLQTESKRKVLKASFWEMDVPLCLKFDKQYKNRRVKGHFFNMPRELVCNT